ncbi:MAG TPA: HNH endonuclease [Hanamia sp.]|nr:HNH endonuclease [Hanamia sp.]
MANKKIDIYMPLLIGDWLKGTRGMKAEIRGVYINLLLYQWDNGFIPSGIEELRLIDPEIDKVWVSLKSKFEEFEPGRLRNNKNDEVKNFFTKQRENGKEGGRPKGTTKSKIISQEKMDWEEMLAFFDYSCLCCGYKFENPDENRPTKDHIIAKANGGEDDITNYQPLCRQCNSSKWATHSTDYRLKFISKIPAKLREKWFKGDKLKITQKKTKDNIHNMNYELEYEFNSEDGNFEKSEKLFENENFKKSENQEKFLVPEMLKEFKNHLKTYQDDVSKDFRPLGLIAQFICNAQDIPYRPREPDCLKTILDNWRIISEFIAQDNFFKNWNLITIEKHIQTICQTIINHESGNSKKGKTGSGKISGERLNEAFAQFYSVG